MTDKTIKRIERILLRGCAHGTSEHDIINQLKSVGVTKADMDRYTAYVKEHNHDTINTTN